MSEITTDNKITALSFCDKESPLVVFRQDTHSVDHLEFLGIHLRCIVLSKYHVKVMSRASPGL